MDYDSSSEEDLPIRFKKVYAVKKKFPEKKDPPLISFNEVIMLIFVLSSSYGGYLIASMITFSTLNEEVYNGYNGFTSLFSLLFTISAIVYIRDINRSNDNDNEDWLPEELVFEYTLEHAEGDKSIPEDVLYCAL